VFEATLKPGIHSLIVTAVADLSPAHNLVEE
jgi:hypothetical protein